MRGIIVSLITLIVSVLCGCLFIFELIEINSNTYFVIIIVLSSIVSLLSLCNLLLKLYYNYTIKGVDEDIIENNRLIKSIRTTVSHINIVNLVFLIVLIILTAIPILL